MWMFFAAEEGFTLIPHLLAVLFRCLFRLGLCGEPCCRPANIKKDNLGALRFLWHSGFPP